MGKRRVHSSEEAWVLGWVDGVTGITRKMRKRLGRFKKTYERGYEQGLRDRIVKNGYLYCPLCVEARGLAGSYRTRNPWALYMHIMHNHPAFSIRRLEHKRVLRRLRNL